MKKSNNNLIAILFVFAVVAGISFSQSYPLPSLSPKDLAEWAIRGGHIASGTDYPTATSGIDVGALYVDTSVATAPMLYRFDGFAWQLMGGGGSGGGGVATHSLLFGLSFSDSGHTGFNSAASFTEHTETVVNPHGASMTVEESITVGDSAATPTATIDNPADGAIRIASFAVLIPLSGLPGVASGGICFLENEGFYFCDGATWTKFEP